MCPFCPDVIVDEFSSCLSVLFIFTNVVVTFPPYFSSSEREREKERERETETETETERDSERQRMRQRNDRRKERRELIPI